jgi:prophage regulatory protein
MKLASVTRPQVRKDRLLRLPEVEQATGLKRSTLYGLRREGRFPPGVQITARCVAWPESTVLQWVQDRIGEAKAAAFGGRYEHE